MNKKLSPKELIALIETCQKSGISNFECGELKFSFAHFQKTEQATVSLGTEDPELEAENLEAHDLQSKQEYLDFLRLSDPLEYENLIARDELKNDRQADI